LSRIRIAAAIIATALTVPLAALPASAAPLLERGETVASAPAWHATQLEVPADATHVEANAINQTGKVVGSVDQQPMVWDSITGKGRALPMPSGYNHGYPYDINDAGIIVGTVYGTGARAARWNLDGSVDVFETSGSETGARVINNNGDIAGWSGGATGPKSPVRFVGADHTPEPLEGDPQDTGAVTGISDGGIVIGFYRRYMCNCPEHGFEQGLHGKMLLSPAPNGISEPSGIQGDGLRIVGTVDYQAVSWRIGLSPATHQPYWKRTSLGHLRPGAATYAKAISHDGERIVGSAEVGGGTLGWVYRDGGFAELPGPNSDAWDVNNAGSVLGAQNGHPAVWRLS
jgi:uncharacterized membrane protein